MKAIAQQTWLFSIFNQMPESESMRIIKIRSYVGEDGILHLDIPVEMKETELEVTMTLKPIKKQPASLEEEELRQLQWYEFIDKTYGCLADDPIIRHSQGEYEQRESIE
ncbi:hypothetical protein [Nostoc sp.]|uniref:hypothetical protein n=1 Tax=Nostoc sp. TaxID=1180 RepID=UPI003593FE3F